MKYDMNFFAPYESQGKKGTQNRILKVLVAFVLCCIIIAPMALFGYTYYINQRTAEIQNILNQPHNVEIMAELEKKQTQLNSIQKILPTLKDKDKILAGTEWFNEELLQLVVDTIPKQVRLTGMQLLVASSEDGSPNSVNTIEMQAIALDRPAIAELEYNLNRGNRFDKVFVSVIDEEAGSTVFAIKFNVKDVNAQ